MPNRRTFLRSSLAGSAGLLAANAAADDSQQTTPDKPVMKSDSADELKKGGKDMTPGQNPVLNVALIGCGGRGRGAAVQALRADPDTRLVAVADAFPEAIERGIEIFSSIEDIKDRVDVPEERRFAGLDCHTQLLDKADVDVVLLATPPHFRPAHYRACVEKGKHVFAEKPVAVDSAGLRHVRETNAMAKRANLSVVSGLCWRYETGMIETIQQIQNGAIGTPLYAESVRYSGHVGRVEPREKSKTEFEHQLRNWFFYPWLSGDFCVEQFVHDLDMVCWALGEYPTKCVATGGRETRDPDKHGVIYDHFAGLFTFPSGLRFTATTRHQNGCSNPYQNTLTGTEGRADLMRYKITDLAGSKKWHRREKITVMHQLEHDAMYAALRAGNPIHNGDYMVDSTAMGVLLRECAYTGKELTIDQVWESPMDLKPNGYSFDADPPEQVVPVPGATQFPMPVAEA